MKRTPIRRVRQKPRPGRLKGADLLQLRHDCYDRDGGRCVECRRAVYFYANPIAEDSYHMAHITAKRMGGDSLDNVRTLCGWCHRKEHNAGGKPVPAKEKP